MYMKYKIKQENILSLANYNTVYQIILYIKHFQPKDVPTELRPLKIWWVPVQKLTYTRILHPETIIYLNIWNYHLSEHMKLSTYLNI
jgi:hypothetical protein